jgi:tryptophan-rich sensory protein
MMESLTLAQVLLVIGFIWIAYYIFIGLPAEMAYKRNRSQIFWVLVSLIFTPFAAIGLLLLVGQGRSE